MANTTNPPVGRSVGHDWAVSVATSGQFRWPPTGSSNWPLTLEAVALALNNRPRKSLDWKTPAEVFEEQLRSLQQPSGASTG